MVIKPAINFMLVPLGYFKVEADKTVVAPFSKGGLWQGVASKVLCQVRIDMIFQFGLQIHQPCHNLSETSIGPAPDYI